MFMILCATFIIGIISGTLCVKTLSDVQKSEMINYLSNFFKIIGNTDNINKNQMFIQLLINNLKIYALLLVFGLFTVGVFLIPALVLFKGFILGFTIGFILDELFLMGFLFTLLVIFPQNIVYIVGIVFSSLLGMNMSYQKLMNRNKHISKSSKRNIQQIIYYFISLTVAFSITAIGCAFEAYITPFFMMFFSNKLF